MAPERHREFRDAVLIRTGYITLWEHPEEFMRSGKPIAQAGLTNDAADHLAAHSIRLVGADTVVVEQVAAVTEPLLAVHMILLVDHGIPMLGIVNLEPPAREPVHEFAFMMAPPPIVGTTASPVRSRWSNSAVSPLKWADGQSDDPMPQEAQWPLQEHHESSQSHLVPA